MNYYHNLIRKKEVMMAYNLYNDETFWHLLDTLIEEHKILIRRESTRATVRCELKLTLICFERIKSYRARMAENDPEILEAILKIIALRNPEETVQDTFAGIIDNGDEYLLVKFGESLAMEKVRKDRLRYYGFGKNRHHFYDTKWAAQNALCEEI